MTPVSDLALKALHATATEIFTGALAACSIESAFDRRIRIEGNVLYLLMPEAGGPKSIDLATYKRVFVIAIGKAAGPMLDAFLSRIERRKGMRGICCSNQLPEKRNWRFRYFEGGHPVPNQESFAAARATLSLLRKAKEDTIIFFLISGGGSAMFDLPLDPNISLDDAVAFHQALLACGAPIHEINILRKHFSAVKGGRLAMAAPEAGKISLLLPDVPLSSLDALSSGPTLPDHSTIEDARRILTTYNLYPKLPSAVAAFFECDDRHGAPGNKSWSGDEAFRDSVYEVLLSSHDLVENARAIAEKAGYYVAIDNRCDDWDYADAARYLLSAFHLLRTAHPRLCLLSAGEVTVTLNRTPGAGGRNQQFALACALELANYPGEALTVLSAGTDGIDGNTQNAGSLADPTTVSRAALFGYDAQQSLAEFNASPLFAALGDTVVTGPTGHNLRDLRVLLAAGS